MDIDRKVNEVHYRNTISAFYRNIIGNSDSMHHIDTLIKKIAPSSRPVLILGKMVCKKNLITGAIHANSLKADRLFIKVAKIPGLTARQMGCRIRKYGINLTGFKTHTELKRYSS